MSQRKTNFTCNNRFVALIDLYIRDAHVADATYYQTINGGLDSSDLKIASWRRFAIYHQMDCAIGNSTREETRNQQKTGLWASIVDVSREVMTD